MYHASSQDNDQQARECSLSAMGSLLAHFGDVVLAVDFRRDSLLALMLRRLENDITRVSLSKICKSSLATPYLRQHLMVWENMFGIATSLLSQQD